MRVVSLFSGIGAFEKALTNLGINYDLVNFCEVDKYAITSYCAIHNVDENKNLGDISKINNEDLPRDIDLLTHGSPCQSFSVVGTGDGGDKNSGTKSSLMWETVRIVEAIKPRVVIWENVKAVLNKNHNHNFQKYLSEMESVGYINYWKVLKSSDYGSAQKRERIFVISLLDNKIKFDFENLKQNSSKRIGDILETSVSIEYNLTKKQLTNWFNKKPPFGDRFSLKQYNDKACTLIAKGGNAAITNNFILVEKQDYKRITELKGKQCLFEILEKDIQVRMLTPLEYWRLQGFDDVDYFKALSAGVSKSQLYKQAGNSIVVDVLESIFKELYK